MSRRHLRPFTICLAASLGLLAPPLTAQAPDTAALSRQFFKRPDVPPAPPDNPLTPEKIALGAQLFSDPRLSGTGRHSCASCHRPARAFTDGRGRPAPSPGKHSGAIRRPYDSRLEQAVLLDGRAPSLEAQVRMPIEAATRWPATGRPFCSGSRRTPVSSPVSGRISRGACHFGGHRRQGTCVLCPLARLAAGPVRRLDRR